VVLYFLIQGIAGAAEALKRHDRTYTVTSEETASAVAQLTCQATDMQTLVRTFRLSPTEPGQALVCHEPQTPYWDQTTVGV